MSFIDLSYLLLSLYDPYIENQVLDELGRNYKSQKDSY